MGHPMRLELTRVGLLVELANHYATRGAQTNYVCVYKRFLYIYILYLMHTYVNMYKYVNECVQITNDNHF